MRVLIYGSGNTIVCWYAIVIYLSVYLILTNEVRERAKRLNKLYAVLCGSSDSDSSYFIDLSSSKVHQARCFNYCERQFYEATV